MAIAARLSAWWSAWQFVIYLAAALCVSAALNVWQWKRAITAPLRGQVAGLEQAREDALQINADMRSSAQRLSAEADAAATQLAGAGKAYARAAQRRPLTPDNCGPGQARMDATNRAMGAPPEK